MLDFPFRGETREALEAMAESVGILVRDENDALRVADGDVTLDPAIGSPEYESDGIPIVATPAVLDDEGNVVTPAEMRDGYHVNVRISGAREAHELDGIPQTDANGDLLPLKGRTRFGQMMTANGTTEVDKNGHTTATVFDGVWLIDPETIETPARIFQ